MGFEEGQIILDSPNGSYFAGQTIFGKVVFDEQKVLKFRGIYVKIKGTCKVEWTTQHRRSTQYHQSEEEYIHTTIYLVGDQSGDHSLQPGHHELPFQFVIPANCPSSFTGSKGEIKYKIKSVVDRAFKIDLEMSRDITVIAVLDLNTDPYCKEPMEFEMEDTYCCCCMSSGSSNTVIKLGASGFVPGQVVPIDIGCTTRGSSLEIDEIQFVIKKKITYTAVKNPDTKTESSEIGRTVTGPVGRDTTRNWTINYQIPNEAVGSIATCKYIDITYKLKVTIVPSGCQCDSDESKRIVIGNVPLAGLVDHSQNVTAIQSQAITNQPLLTSPPPYCPTEMPIYPGANPPYPAGNAPYPEANIPYPGEKTPFLAGNAPYPGEKSSFPGTTSPYPAGNLPYPGATSPNPTGNPPYPAGNSPYPGAPSPNPTGNPPYPAGNPPYPRATSPNPTGNPPYLAGSAPYPGATLPNPTGNPPYPAGNAPYPGATSPNPTGNPPYPAGNSPNLGATSPNPTGNLPYPGRAVPYPAATPYPPAPQDIPYQKSPNPSVSGLKTGTVGFVGVPQVTPAAPPPANPYASASAPNIDN